MSRITGKFSLINFSLIEFTRRVIKGGPISSKGILFLPIYYLQLIFALPFEFLQFLVYGRRIKNTIISSDPIFILGHYRSGTTYLQKLMVSDKRLGCITNYDSLLPNFNLLLGKKMQPIVQFIINAFKIKNPFFHNSIVQLSDPGEEDDYLMNKASPYSAYWGFVFPKRWREWLNDSHLFTNSKYYDGWKREYLNTLKYATFKNKGKQLVLKSPPNTARINELLQLFPNAKFIYIYRNPFHVYYSIKNMWRRAVLKYYSLQKITDQELDEIIFEHFSYLIERYEKDKKAIPSHNLIEISYEKIMEDSYKVMQQIYIGLNLPDFELTNSSLLSQLEKEKGYQKFQYQFKAETLHRINERWAKYILARSYESA